MRDAPTKRSPAYCEPSPVPRANPTGEGAMAYFQLNSGSVYFEPGSL